MGSEDKLGAGQAEVQPEGEAEFNPELTLLIADDQAATRIGIRRAVEPHGLRVVGEVGSVAEALAAAAKHQPDVCLLSTRMPGNGIEGARLIRKTVPDTKIVMLTSDGRSDELLASLQAGADGYLLMTTSAERLHHAIRGVVNGQAALPRELTAVLIREFRDRGNHRRITLPSQQHVDLTAREFEVGERLRRGERTSEVAAHLGISEVTVRRHISALVQKLAAPDRKGMLAMLERADADRQTRP
jgi:two-component system, NarL family, nitrate/nitrite response regulator NarL